MMAIAKKLCATIFLTAMTLTGIWAQDKQADTLHLKVHFKRGEVAVDASFHENWSRLSAFQGAVSSIQKRQGYTLEKINIRAGASPDGNTKTNQELSEGRAQSLLWYLSETLSVPQDSFKLFAVGEDWDGLAGAVRKLQQPWSPEALSIIVNTPIWVKDNRGNIVDSRKNQLRSVADGDAWRYLVENVFEEVCSTGTAEAIFRRETDGEKIAAAPVEQYLINNNPSDAGGRRLADYLGWTMQDSEISRSVLEIQFRLDKTDIDLDFAGNRSRVQQFLADYQHNYASVNPAAIQVDIYAGASPEGPAAHNVDLGRGRCDAIRELLQGSLGLPSANIVTHNLASRWCDLYDAVLASNESWKDEVLAIIRLKPSANVNERDHRELKLRALDNGRVWPELLNGYLAPLRSGGSAVVSYHPEADTTAPALRQQLLAEIAKAGPIKDTLFLIEDKVLARKNCVAMPLRRAASGLAPCPTRVALSPDYLQTLSALMRDTLEVRFRLDSTRIDAGFAGNRFRIARFMDSFGRRYRGLDPHAMQLDIYAGASPEGTADHNRWLGQERGASIRRLLRDSLGIRVGNIEIHNLAARWDDFYDAVAASNEPWKDEVLAIIRQEPSRDTKSRDHREAQLRALRGGEVWPILLDRYLAPLRSGGSAVLSIDPQYLSQVMQNASGNGTPCGDAGWTYAGDTLWVCGGALQPSQKDTVVVMQNTPYGMYPYDNYPWDNLPEGYYFDSNGFLRKKQVKKVLVPADKTPAWAVKTNLLFWGVVAPNVSVEIPLGWRNRWALEWEYDHPWFIWSENSHASQILNMSLELRLYLGNRDYHRWLDGWHIGLAFGGGKYDWEWTQHEGWQGEFINPYFNFGYQHRWGKHWAVDAGMGIGVIPSRYRHYYGGSVYPDNHLEPWDIHLIYHDKGHFVYPGITHINVSISYMFNNWPFLMHNMSERKRQQWSETYSERTQKEREARYQKERARVARANVRDEAKEQRRAAKKAAKQAKKAK